MIFSLNENPFVKIILAFVLGILIGNLTIHSPVTIAVPTIFCLIILIVLILFFITKFKNSFLFGLYIFLIFISLGIYRFSFCINSPAKFNEEEENQFIAQLYKPSIEKENTVKVFLRIIQTKKDSIWEENKFNTVAYIEKDSLSVKLDYGDVILASAKLRIIKNQNNPNEFDIRTYLNRQNIYHQAVIHTKRWKKIANKPENSLIAFSEELKQKLLKIYRQAGLKNQEFAVAAALTIGYTDEIDDETRRIYATTGAMHILSISGLHIGIIFILINYILFFLSRTKILRILKALTIISVLWFFALLSGLSPSVNRAAFMFSLIVLAKLFSRNISIYNTLAVSAFVLLVINPNVLFNVGFQLSYIAIGSIALFQKPIETWFYFPKSYMQKIWTFSVVSIAAQLGTFPLAVYYFNQFPNFFLFTNLIAIPLSTIALYSGVSLFAVFKVSILSGLSAWFLNYSILLLNKFLFFTDSIPGSYVVGIYLSGLQTILIYSLILIAFFSNRYRFSKILILLSIILFMGIYEKRESISQKSFTVFNIKKKNLISFTNQGQAIFLTDSTLSKCKPKLNYYTNGYLVKNFLKEISVITLKNNNKPANEQKEWQGQFYYQSSGFIQFAGTRILLINNKTKINKKSDRKIAIDYLILAQNVPFEISEILQQYEVKQIIIDGSNTLYRSRKWIRDGKNKGILCYYTGENGAFCKKL